MVFPKANTDMVDAVRSCEIFDEELKLKEKKLSGRDKPKRQVMYRVRENGTVVTKWRDC